MLLGQPLAKGLNIFSSKNVLPNYDPDHPLALISRRASSSVVVFLISKVSICNVCGQDSKTSISRSAKTEQRHARTNDFHN